MPYSLNQISCNASGGNIGQVNCQYTLLRDVGTVAIPTGTIIPASAFLSITAFRAYFKLRLQDSVLASRWFILGTFIGVESNGQEAGFYTAPNRTRVLTQDPVKSMRYEVAGFCYYQQIARKNGLAGGYQFMNIATTTSGEMVLVAVATVDTTTGITQVGGVDKSLFYVEPPTSATMTDPERYFFQSEDLDISQSTIYRSIFVVGAGFIQAMQPLAVKDVNIVNITPSGAASGVFTFQLEIGCGGISLVDLVPAVASPTNLIFKNAATGGTITATTVIVSTTNSKALVATLDTADTDYPAAGGYITVQLAGLGTILTPIGAYESDVETFPRS